MGYIHPPASTPVFGSRGFDLIWIETYRKLSRLWRWPFFDGCHAVSFTKSRYTASIALGSDSIRFNTHHVRPLTYIPVVHRVAAIGVMITVELKMVTVPERYWLQGTCTALNWFKVWQFIYSAIVSVNDCSWKYEYLYASIFGLLIIICLECSCQLSRVLYSIYLDSPG